MQHEPTLAEMVFELWRAKFYLVAGGVLGLVFAFAWMATAVPYYQATMLVAPAERSGGVDIKALLPENTSFAVQYLVNSIGSSDSNDFVRFENIMTGPGVAAELADDKELMAALARKKRFSFLDGGEPADDAATLAVFLKEHVKIMPVGTTALRRVTFDHPDPHVALDLLERVYGLADGIIREEVVGRTNSRAAYLQGALLKTSHPDHKRAMTSLLMEQEHIRMVMAMGEPFAAIIAETPFTRPKPVWPRKAVIFPSMILLGLFLGYTAYALRRQAKLSS